MSDVLINESVIAKFNRPGPRYTSYPTAPEWSEDVTGEVYHRHLVAFGQNPRDLSLYVHIPFCESLCYFCGCMTNIRPSEKKYGDEYVDHLTTEINRVADAIGTRKLLRQLHWGGGTPTFLTEDQIRRLFQSIQTRFDLDVSGDISIEVEPRRITESKVRLLRELGFNRISIGVQDFDPRVQESVHRVQPYDCVAQFHGWCRSAGFASVNFDLIYGLPYQTLESFRRTVELVCGLRPDRIALYSFAHIPWLRKHQNKLEVSQLPAPGQKVRIFLQAREIFLSQGYEAIAMDHFALAGDELAKAFRAGRLYRNFMGYTTKPADEYIGVGASAIGYLGGGYFQNLKTVPAYYHALAQGRLPVERGKVLTDDDLCRQWVINQLMCRFVLDRHSFQEHFRLEFDSYFPAEQEHILRCVADGLLSDDGARLEATALGRIFIRNVCMGFDSYLRQKGVRQKFSSTV